MRPRLRRSRTAVTIALAAVLAVGGLPSVPAAADTPPGSRTLQPPNVVIQWSNAGMSAISKSTMGPPMVARAYAMLHTCIYDAWAAHDPRAAGTMFSGRT